MTAARVHRTAAASTAASPSSPPECIEIRNLWGRHGVSHGGWGQPRKLVDLNRQVYGVQSSTRRIARWSEDVKLDCVSTLLKTLHLKNTNRPPTTLELTECIPTDDEILLNPNILDSSIERFESRWPDCSV